MRLDLLEAWVTRGARVIALIGLAGLLALIFATVLDVFMRWLFNSPITGVRDTYSLFLGIIIASCYPICVAERRNITIRFAGNMLGPRISRAFELFGGLVTLAIFIIMIWKTWAYANELKMTNDTTWILGWPSSPWWRGVTILIALSIPILIVILLQDAKSIFSRKDTPEEEHHQEKDA